MRKLIMHFNGKHTSEVPNARRANARFWKIDRQVDSRLSQTVIFETGYYIIFTIASAIRIVISVLNSTVVILN